MDSGVTSLKILPFCPSSNIKPSRDAVDDQFRHTYDALAGIIRARPIARPMAYTKLIMMQKNNGDALGPCLILRHQVMQLTTDSSTPIMPWLV